MLQHPDKANLQEQGCAALYNLSLGEGITIFCTYSAAGRAHLTSVGCRDRTS